LGYLRYLQECVRKNARVDSVHNAIIIGDSLLKVAYNGPDADMDGLSDQYEVTIGTDPTRPDSDGDGLTDYRELKLGMNPMNADTDGDGVKDGVDPHPLDPIPENASVIRLSPKPNWLQTNWSCVAILATVTAIVIILVMRIISRLKTDWMLSTALTPQ